MLDFLLPDGILEERPPYWFAVLGRSPFRERYDGRRRAAHEGALAKVLILEPAGEMEGGAFISSYDATCAFIGDTWFSTREEALATASAEHSDLANWIPIPDDELDAETYALLHATGHAS